MATTRDIVYQRLYNQRLIGAPFKNPADVVGSLGAVQAQDYAGAKWAVAQRTDGLADADIERSFSRGEFLRTHVLRPTWHFVLPADIRWMLELTAPRINARLAVNYRTTGLDDALLARTDAILGKALQGGKQLTRAELTTALNDAGVDTGPSLRFLHILIHAELAGVICSGAWRGKQPTWALLAERAPQARSLPRDEALSELARRYFASHGPATLKDYVWWSGLTTQEARTGLDLAGPHLEQCEIDGRTYWYAGTLAPSGDQPLVVHLLPNYDEYIVAYADRSMLYDAQHSGKLDSRGNVLFNYTIVVNSQVVGTWKRTFKKAEVIIELIPFIPLTAEEDQAVRAAAERFGAFMRLRVQYA